MCLKKFEQWICQRHVVTRTGWPINLMNIGSRESGCNGIFQQPFEWVPCNRTREYDPSCAQHQNRAHRRWFGLCSRCALVATQLLQEGFTDHYRKAREFVLHWTNGAPEEFHVHISRDDGGGLELRPGIDQWELCCVMTGIAYQGTSGKEDWQEADRTIGIPP